MKDRDVAAVLGRFHELLGEYCVNAKEVQIVLSGSLWNALQRDLEACRQWNSTREGHKKMHELQTGEVIEDGPVRETTINGDLRVRKDG